MDCNIEQKSKVTATNTTVLNNLFNFRGSVVGTTSPCMVERMIFGMKIFAVIASCDVKSEICAMQMILF